jgi:hypothetical protein
LSQACCGSLCALRSDAFRKTKNKALRVRWRRRLGNARLRSERKDKETNKMTNEVAARETFCEIGAEGIRGNRGVLKVQAIEE